MSGRAIQAMTCGLCKLPMLPHQGAHVDCAGCGARVAVCWMSGGYELLPLAVATHHDNDHRLKLVPFEAAAKGEGERGG